MTGIETVTRLLGQGRLRFGEAQGAGALTVVPVFHDGEAARYRLFAELAGGSSVLIEELPGGSVPELVVTNRTDSAVLILEGEVLSGLKQARTLNITVLVPAGATLAIPVSCVEARRWGAARPMAREEVHASPGVRASKNLGVQELARLGAGYRSHQGEVWRAVDHHLSRHEVASPSASYAEVHRRRSGDIGEITGPLRPAPGQRGVLALAAGRPLALDVFDRPETLAALWPGLVASYAADALVASAPAGGTAAAADGVAALAGGKASTHTAVGLGEVVFLTSAGVVVSALVVGEALVHLAAVWAPEATGEGPAARAAGGARRSWFGEPA